MKTTEKSCKDCNNPNSEWCHYCEAFNKERSDKNK